MGGTEVTTEDSGEVMDEIVLRTRHAGPRDPGDRRVVAYHESGHALVAKLAPGATPVSKITIIPHGQALGVTGQFSEEDRRNHSKS